MLQSVQRAPLAMASRNPSRPRATAATASGLVSMVKVTSLWRAASAGVAASLAPSLASPLAFSGERFHTESSCTGFYQVGGHAAAHDPQSDERDLHSLSLLT